MPMQVGISSPGGFIGGMMAGEAFRQQKELAKIAIANEQADLAAKEKLAKDTADLQRKLAEAGPTLAQIADPSDRALKVTETVMPYNPALGVEMLKQTAQMQDYEAQARERELTTTIMRENANAALLDAVTDMESLEAVTIRAQTQGFDTKGALPMLLQLGKTQGWDAVKPHLIAARRRIISARDEAAIALDEERAKTEQQRQRTEAARRELIPFQKKEIEARTAKLEKEGEVETKFTASARVLAAKKIADKYDMEQDKDRLYVLSDEAVELAKDFVREDPGLTQSQAIDKAFTAMEESLSFAGYPERMAVPGSRQLPMPIPMKRGQIQVDKLINNRVYEGIGEYAGQSVVWNGTGFDLLEEETE